MPKDSGQPDKDEANGSFRNYFPKVPKITIIIVVVIISYNLRILLTGRHQWCTPPLRL
jgi:hypothetical protein